MRYGSAFGFERRRRSGVTGGGATVGGGVALSAPALGYPSPLAANPTAIVVRLGVDWQSGDALKLAYSSSSAMTSPTILSHTINDTDITNGTASLSIPTLAGTKYFQGYGNHAGADSTNLSNIVAWGDTTAPVITTSGTQSVFETAQLAIALTGTDAGGIASWAIVGGPDQLQFQIVGTTLQWVGNGSQSVASPNDQGLDSVYNVTVQATDFGGNLSTPLAIAVTVNAIDQTPDAFAFTNVSNATHSTQYTSNTVTLSGLQVGFNIPASLSGTGFTYSKNGGAYQAAGSFTVQNGDTITLRDTSGATDGVTNVATLVIGTASQGWSVSTPGLNFLLNSTYADASAWTLGSGCSISGGALHATGAGAICQQPITTWVNGGTYQADLDYTCTSGSELRLNQDISNGANVRVTSGALTVDGASHHLTLTFTSNVTSDYLSLEAALAVFTGTIDNFTCVRTA